MSTKKPKIKEPDYKGMADNYFTWRREAQKGLQEDLSAARARMGASGIKAGSDAWNRTLADVQANYDKDAKELQRGYSAKEIKGQMKRDHAYLGDSSIPLDDRLKQAQDEMAGLKDQVDKYNKLDHEDQQQDWGGMMAKHQMTRLQMLVRGVSTAIKGRKFLEDTGLTGVTDWEAYAAGRFGVNGRPEKGLSPEDAAIERAGLAAKGGRADKKAVEESAASPWQTPAAEDENKEKALWTA